MSDYNQDDVYSKLNDLNIEKGDTLYITGNLSRLGKCNLKKEAILNLFFEAFLDLIGYEGTIVFPTFTFSICNSAIPFSLKETKSETGILSEFIRKKKGAIRSLHPFSSVVAYGKNAEFICTNNSKYAYGPMSPYDRLLSLNGKNISIGMQPETTCSIVHHAEQMMSVPYRYIKEFNHQIIQNNGDISNEKFYLNCLYLDLDVKRDKNKKIFKSFRNCHDILQIQLGKGQIFSYEYIEFYNHIIGLMKDDPYIWLEKEPIKKTYIR